MTELYSKENRRLDYISYDYSSNQFLAVYVTGEGNAKGYRFLYDKFDFDRNFKLNINNIQVGNKIILFNDSLIFTSHALDKPSNKSILKWRLPDGQLNGRIETPIPLQWRDFFSQALALMDRKGRPQVSNRCEGKQSVCSHIQDYCIPHSRKAFICKSHVSWYTPTSLVQVVLQWIVANNKRMYFNSLIAFIWKTTPNPPNGLSSWSPFCVSSLSSLHLVAPSWPRNEFAFIKFA